MITGLNENIATTLFPVKSLQVEVKAGYGAISNRSSLTELTVLIGNKEKGIEVGDLVYVSSGHFNQSWAKTEIDLDGRICIIVPFNVIQFVKKPDRGPWIDEVGVR